MQDQRSVVPGLDSAGGVITDFGFKKVVDKQQSRSSLAGAFSSWSANQNPQNMRELLTAANPVLDKAITSYGGGDKALRGRAKRLAISAFKNYDPSRGTKLQTHLLIRLQPLRREHMARSTPVSIPERVQFDKMKLNNAEEAFKDAHERDPSDQELADMTSLSTKRIAHVRRFARGIISEGQTDDPASGISTPGASQVTPEDIWIEYVHHDLDPIDKKILEWRTGMFDKDKVSTGEIARRLKLTPSAISQRAAKIALQMEEWRNSGG